ncbi:MAG: glycosyltransferase family 4 protein [Ignavibacteriae bacterium]|nr:glycosyltransferase family 4 protein [Ignavibacteriota bacterium]
MHIVYMNPHYDAGIRGPDELLARYTASTGWCEALAAMDTRVTCVQRFGTDAALERNGVSYHFVSDGLPPRLPPWAMPLRTLRLAASHEPDLIHVNGRPTTLVPLRRITPRSTSLVWQHHGGPDPAFPRRRIYATFLRCADAAIFTSREQGEAWKSRGLLPFRAAIFAVQEASTYMECPSAPQFGDSGAGAPHVLWVGRLNACKDPITVLHGFAEMRVQSPRAFLTMAYSDAPMLDRVREEIARLGITGAVRLRGTVPHNAMPALYAQADIFVLGSHAEGCGFALLEAMACGVYPAVTGIPPFRVLTRNGEMGALWEPGDAGSCARALLAAAAGRPPAADVRVFFDRHLSWPAVAARVRAAYAEVVATRHRRAAGGPR